MCDSYVLASIELCGAVLRLVCVTNQIMIASLLLPAQWVCLLVRQSGPKFTASREKQTSLTLKSDWKTPSIPFWTPGSSAVLNRRKRYKCDCVSVSFFYDKKRSSFVSKVNSSSSVVFQGQSDLKNKYQTLSWAATHNQNHWSKH